MRVRSIANVRRGLARIALALDHGEPPAIQLTEVDCNSFSAVQMLPGLLTTDGSADRVFKQDDARWVNTTPQGLNIGTTVFGDGYAAPMMATPRSRTLARELSTYSCRNAVLLPISGSIVTYSGSLVRDTIENADHFGGIEYVEPAVARNSDGLHTTFSPRKVESINATAISCAGVGGSNYGHFIFDGLQQAFLLHTYFRKQKVVIASGPLKVWQRELFSILGIADDVVELTAPTRFKRILSTTLRSLHVSYTTRYCRPLYDALKFIVGTDQDAPQRIYIKRPEGSARRMLNEQTVIEFLQSLGFVVLQPENYSVRDQIRLFSNANIVVAQTGAALANVGFCPPGCEVVEIMPECYFDQWIRSTSFYLAQNWRVIFCSVPEASKYGLRAGVVNYPDSGFDFSVDLEELRNALVTVQMSVAG